jgi:hypothetical protein
MCGISGYLNFRNSRPPEHIQATLGLMNDALHIAP